MHAAHRLRPQISQTGREHRNILSCESEHDLLQELGSIQPDPRNLVIRSKAADAVPEAAGSVPDASHLLGTVWILALSPVIYSFFLYFLFLRNLSRRLSVHSGFGLSHREAQVYHELLFNSSLAA